MEYPWQDGELLRELYVKQAMGYRSIAKELGTSKKTIQKWVKKFDFETHNPEDYGNFGSQGGRPRVSRATYTVNDGYTACHSVTNSVFIHQLTVIADGADPEKVFSNGEYQVHHKNSIKFDNRPSNLELLTRDEHMEKHT